jgi:hypothetical protein
LEENPSFRRSTARKMTLPRRSRSRKEGGYGLLSSVFSSGGITVHGHWRPSANSRRSSLNECRVVESKCVPMSESGVVSEPWESRRPKTRQAVASKPTRADKSAISGPLVGKMLNSISFFRSIRLGWRFRKTGGKARNGEKRRFEREARAFRYASYSLRELRE